ncbi:sn-glycerol-3-phosphate ABC transporter ATP-binding protein UgpC [Paracoccus homiensis]|uniref:Carbohydrate ABC transporter ATP-binding protein, CUT1 family n=1 Tax=Paracoccus homiensis TaxID=364199 RepID=A0A1I0CBV9_9RHOB|nr:sn-glycerol-3-phosphate ABC transporter ATP-binding protein UgpC [Paracoccus homiensis]SET16478.1 carbohydrate ABC transporter ATP-binding protein, CUT1 family [Paracoccus homiensis]
MAQLSVEHLSKTYPNGVTALHPCDFAIERGEFVVLVGPSGCGKSTLLRMIAGLEDISSGQMRIEDRVVNHVEPAERDIAMVFQNYALYPHMTVYRNMAYGIRNRRVPAAEIDRKVRDAAQMLNLTEYLDRRPAQLSGGQRQRVAMGRAIVRDPALFLFDEPLSNLDAKLRNQMRIEIRALQQRLGVTSVYVTHDQIEAMTMADRIFVMNAGRIEQIGTPAEIYHRPASTFVASFMGAPPMNLLRGHGTGTGAVMLSGGLQLDLPMPTDAGRDLVLGLRPEDMRLSPDGPIRFDIQIVEELGATRLLHGQLSEQPFTVAVSKETQAGPGIARLAFAPDTASLFCGQKGHRL